MVEGWQSTAKGLNSVPEMIIQGILPWCFTPEFYSGNPEFIGKYPERVKSLSLHSCWPVTRAS